MRWAPLGNHQFGAMHLFELHGLIQRHDCTLDFAVIWRLRGDPLQPQSRRRHQREERAAMFSGKANDLVGDAGNRWQQSNSNRKSRPESLDWDRHIDEHRDDHYGHQETRPAARMICRIFLYRARLKRIAVLECEYRLVLSTVILIDAANVFPQRHAPHKEQE